MRKSIIIIAASLLCCVSSFAQEKGKNYETKRGDWALSVTFNPASLGYKMSCQPKAGEFVGSWIENQAASPKQMFLVSQDPLTSVQLKYYTSDKQAFRLGFGFNGSVVNYREYVTDDLAVALNPESQNKVADAACSRLNTASISLGSEWKAGTKAIKFVYGVNALYTIAGGDLAFFYGNKMTDINRVPSSMPLTAKGGKLDDGQGRVIYRYCKPR